MQSPLTVCVLTSYKQILVLPPTIFKFMGILIQNLPPTN